jgi:hypothetical protein
MDPGGLLLATDPLRARPVAFALVDQNDVRHTRRFLKNLKAHGFAPEVVVTDGSPLYPALLAEVWPDARHQLRVFHVLQEIHAKVLGAVRRLRRPMARRGTRGRKRGRGRPPKSRGPVRGPDLGPMAAGRSGRLGDDDVSRTRSRVIPSRQPVGFSEKSRFFFFSFSRPLDP